MKLDFIAIDLETANADLASVCQIGLATVREGRIVDVWSALVDPEDYFDPFNVSIHGIDENKVVGAPGFAQVYSEVLSRTDGSVMVSHTSFDRCCVASACQGYELPEFDRAWLDSARVARRAWPDLYARSGYGLANVAANLGIEFKHHDAGEDARAAAEIVIRASEIAGLDLDGWLQRVQLPIDPTGGGTVRREGNPEGPLYGEVLVFTGALALPRRTAADLAAVAGCTVESNVTKATTLLVVGDQDIMKLAGHDKSRKHRKAEKLIQRGQSIRILRESDFKKIVELVPA